DLSGPTDAQILPSGRVLIAENWAGKVTERDDKGKVFWEYKPTNYPLSCWRLDSGNTVVVTRKDVSEVTPDGKAVWTQERAIRFGMSLRDGGIVLLTQPPRQRSTFFTLDADGRQRGASEPEEDGGSVFSTLPGGRFLVGDAFKVCELDRKGRLLHELKK